MTLEMLSEAKIPFKGFLWGGEKNKFFLGK